MWGRTATELAAGLRAREFSAREVMEAHLERIAEVNPRVNAIVTLLEPRARAARSPTRPTRAGRAACCTGLPIAVKDLEDTAGMRTTYGSPLFADARARARLAARRAPARGGRGDDRQDQHAGVRRRLADVQRGLRRHPQPVGPDARRPAGRAAARRPRSPPGCCRSPTAPTSARASATRRRSATSSACAPRPGRIPDHGPGRPVEPAAGARARSRARADDVALLFAALAGPDPRDPLSIQEPLAVPRPGAAIRAALRIAWSRDLGGLPVDPEVTDGARDGARATLEALGCVVEDAEPDFSGADECFEVLRGVTLRGRVRGDRSTRSSRRCAENVRFGLALTPARIARALRAARRAVHAHARVPDRATTSLAAPGHPGRRRSTSSVEYPTRDRRRADGLLPRVVPLLLAGSRSPSHPAVAVPGRASRRTGCRSACSSSAATAARPTLLRLAQAFTRRPGSRADAGALDALADDAADGRAPRRLRATPSRARSGCATRASRAPALHGAHRRRPVHRRRRLHRAVGGAVRQGAATRRATSSCSRPRPRASARSGRNGGFAVASLTHGIDNGLARFADEMPVLERLGAGELRRPARRPGAPRDRLRLRADRRAARAHRRLPGAVARGGARDAARASATRSPCSTARRCAPRSHSPTYIGGVWDHTGAGILDPGKLARRAARRGDRAPACACTSTPPCTTCAGDRRGARPRQGRVRARKRPARHQRLSPAAARDRAATSCRSTTTCWSPSRSSAAQLRDRLGSTARASATAATSSTTTA